MSIQRVKAVLKKPVPYLRDTKLPKAKLMKLADINGKFCRIRWIDEDAEPDAERYFVGHIMEILGGYTIHPIGAVGVTYPDARTEFDGFKVIKGEQYAKVQLLPLLKLSDFVGRKIHMLKAGNDHRPYPKLEIGTVVKQTRKSDGVAQYFINRPYDGFISFDNSPEDLLNCHLIDGEWYFEDYSILP